jgi:protein XRP2
MFKMQKDQKLIKMPGDINGIDFMIKDLENCTVMLLDHTAQVTVDRCKNTKFYVGPVKASIFFRDCSDCEITVSCSQFRCRDLLDSKLNLYTPNDPIVESSSGLTIGPYNLRYPFLKEHALAADLVGEFTDDDGVV